jgi:hypothetical protein
MTNKVESKDELINMSKKKRSTGCRVDLKAEINVNLNVVEHTPYISHKLIFLLGLSHFVLLPHS